MITQEKLEKLQKYAQEKDPKIGVSFSQRGSVDVTYDGEHWISLANKATSFLTIKSVKGYIDKCFERHVKISS